MHFMTENAADETAVEKACRDIDRYISETAQPSSNDGQLLTPSERLRVLGARQAGSSKMPPSAQEIATRISE
jgi:hypothetical protein